MKDDRTILCRVGYSWSYGTTRQDGSKKEGKHRKQRSTWSGSWRTSLNRL